MSTALLERPSARPTSKARSQTSRASDKPLSAQEERAIASRIRRGDRQAIERVVLANLGLVGTIARANLGCGLSFDDLKQEGIRGVIRACADFDPETHGVRFSTYASYWIRNAIQQAIAANGSMIRLPGYMIHLRSKYQKTLGELYSEEHENADKGTLKASRGIDHEIAERMGVSLNTLNLIRHSHIERSQFHREAGEGGSISFEETIADNSQPLFDLDDFEEMECLHEGLDLLSPHEAWIIRQRFGLEDAPSRKTEGAGSEPKSITWIARAYGLAPSTLRRLEETALAKLREYMKKRVGEDED